MATNGGASGESWLAVPGGGEQGEQGVEGGGAVGKGWRGEVAL